VPVYSGHSGRLLLAVPVTSGVAGRADADDCVQVSAGVHSWQLRLQAESRPLYLARPERDVAAATLADGEGVFSRELLNFPDTFAGVTAGELAVSGYWDDVSNPYAGAAVWLQPIHPGREWGYAAFRLKLSDDAPHAAGEDGVTTAFAGDPNADRTALSGRGRVTAVESASAARGVVTFSLRVAVFTLTITYDDR
jgi:hypothetical protein